MAASDQRRGQVGHRAGEGDGELAAALVGVLLAFRVGVGKQAADGEQQNGAQAKIEPGGNQEPCGFAHDDGGHEDKKSKAARPAVVGADAQKDKGEQREEDVDAQLDAHPTSQRD